MTPTPAEKLAHQGVTLRDAGQLIEAEAAFRRAIKMAPNRPDMRNDLVVVLVRQNRRAEAREILQRTLELFPNFALSWLNLGILQEDAWDLTSARASFERSLSLDPSNPTLHQRLAETIRKLGDPTTALSHIRQAIQRNPRDASLHGTLTGLLLLTGDYAAGLTELEYRWLGPNYIEPRRPFSTSAIHPDTDLTGKKIVVYGEQGYGDRIHFARYLSLLSQRGAIVFTAGAEDLAPLLATVPGVTRSITAAREDEPADYLLPMMSLPYVFQTRLDSIPAPIPYLTPDPDRLTHWRGILSQYPGRKIGLVYAGRPEHASDKERSMPLAALAPLAATPGVTLFSLQKGPASSQTANPPFPLINLAPDLHTWHDTAAVLSQLDLLISVDTSIVHLAGALGRPVWTLLQFMPDWRWLLNRDDTPWYPTMRLYRQSRWHYWDDVIARVAEDLRLAQ